MDWLSGRKYVVLTFDDGPFGQGVDEQILEVLERHQARAVFSWSARTSRRTNGGYLARSREAAMLLATTASTICNWTSSTRKASTGRWLDAVAIWNG
ncbi:hypothetical protein BV497_14770 [Fulvimonas soli]|nr:hypothetical protein BV497_14770 [Fulvimonas soli]